MNKTDTVIPDRVFKFNESVKKNNGTVEEKQVIDPKKITPKLKSILPHPTGWRLMVLPYRGTGKLKVVYFYRTKQFKFIMQRQYVVMV